MRVVIVGMRGLGVETAKNLCLAGPSQVSIYDPTMTAIADLGSNFYLTEGDVGKKTRAEGSITKLQELNPYVKTDIIADEAALKAYIDAGGVGVVCQTELVINGTFVDPEALDTHCRTKNTGYISTATLGSWGYCFVDYGPKHVCFDQDGEQTKQFIVTMIEKGAEKTKIIVHEDKRHTYQEGDHVVLREIEGMVEMNETAPLKIVSTGKFHFEVELDSTGFSDYVRQGVVENQKVPTNIEFLSWTDCFKNPVKCSTFGMLEVPDLAKFGRSEQLHCALWGIQKFLAANGRYPATADVDACKALANDFMKANGESGMTVEIEDEVFKKAV